MQRSLQGASGPKAELREESVSGSSGAALSNASWVHGGKTQPTRNKDRNDISDGDRGLGNSETKGCWLKDKTDARARRHHNMMGAGTFVRVCSHMPRAITLGPETCPEKAPWQVHQDPRSGTCLGIVCDAWRHGCTRPM